MAFGRKTKKGKVKGNVLLTGISGKFGEVLIIKQYKDKVVYSHPPDMSNVVFTEEQKTNQTLLGLATAYGKMVLKDPKLKALHSKNLNGKRNAFQAAVSYFVKFVKEAQAENEIPTKAVKKSKENNRYILLLPVIIIGDYKSTFIQKFPYRSGFQIPTSTSGEHPTNTVPFG